MRPREHFRLFYKKENLPPTLIFEIDSPNLGFGDVVAAYAQSSTIRRSSMTAFNEIPGNTKVWKNGKFIDWKDANIHVMSHGLHYGSSVFEGIRCYKTKKGPSIWRLDEHVQRLFDSAKMYRMKIPFTLDEFRDALIQTVKVNSFQECYLRPIVFRGTGPFGVNGLDNTIESFICAWYWGAYLGPEALERGVDVMFATWSRFSPNTMPALAKSAANYANSQLIKMEAVLNGYSEGIALDSNGYVSEGSGENIFVIHRGRILTPPLGNSVLPGITRDCVIKILKELGHEVIEGIIPREMVYIADEVFFTGTAAEVTPIATADKIPIGGGKAGPITKAVQKRFFEYVFTDIEDKHGWHTFVK
jgi:branched-chain amino acid aminotransferase